MGCFVCKENKCAGCMACKDICSVNAINVIDSIKHYNAQIDEKRCIGCERCKRVCQYNNTPQMRKPVRWYQGWSKDEEIHNTSSSGGFATEIESMFITNGGIVCSCMFKEGRFVFTFAYNKEEVGYFKGSKYVKSDPSGAYNRIKALLKEGKKVLFLGLPCQVASLKNYCDTENLYTIDLICHGSPSPVVLQSFLRTYGSDIQKVKRISFRNKNVFETQSDIRKFSIPGVRDYYTLSFLKSWSFTENCYECKYAQIERVSDLTIGDAWGSDLPKNVRKKGVSIALCQTEKGLELLSNKNLQLMPIELEKVVKANPRLDHPVEIPKERDGFLRGIINGESFKKIIKKTSPQIYYKNLIKTFLYRVGLYRGENTSSYIFTVEEYETSP